MLVIFVSAQQHELGFIIASYLTFLSGISSPKSMDGKTALETYRPNLAPYEKVYREIHRNPELAKVPLSSSVQIWVDTFLDYCVLRL